MCTSTAGLAFTMLWSAVSAGHFASIVAVSAGHFASIVVKHSFHHLIPLWQSSFN
jgi:hypothetical protein